METFSQERLHPPPLKCLDPPIGHDCHTMTLLSGGSSKSKNETILSLSIVSLIQVHADRFKADLSSYNRCHICFNVNFFPEHQLL